MPQGSIRKIKKKTTTTTKYWHSVVAPTKKKKKIPFGFKRDSEGAAVAVFLTFLLGPTTKAKCKL